MALITYDDKDNALPTSNVRRLFRDVDANEIKDVVNENFTEEFAARTTRESNRAFSTELLFDKNVIQMDTLVQTGPMTITVSEDGNLDDQESVIITKIQSNGVDTITVQHDPHPYFNNFNQGEVLPEGTYKVFILRDLNGEITFSVVKPSYEEQQLIPLATPANFIAVPGAGDPNTEADLSWDDGANETAYELYRSATGGGGPWGSPIATLAAGSTTHTDTGLTPGATYHYRIRALGSAGFANSNFAIAATTTEDTGDITPPTFTFTPEDAATDLVVNTPVTIVSSAPLRDQDGTTAIINSNIGDYVTATGSVSGAIAITGTINLDKTIFTINPVGGAWPENQDITIAIDGVEGSINSVHAVADDATFTTNDLTLAIGNSLNFGNILNPLFTANDANFEFSVVTDVQLFSGTQIIAIKHQTGSRAFLYNYNENGDVKFKWYGTGSVDSSARTREVIWTGVLTPGLHTLRLHYKGAIDTNNGLDRLDLYIDGVLQGSKSVVADDGGAGTAWPFNIRTSAASFIVGPRFSVLKDFQVKSNNGAVTEINVPIVRTGQDISGNNRHGTWV